MIFTWQFRGNKALIQNIKSLILLLFACHLFFSFHFSPFLHKMTNTIPNKGRRNFGVFFLFNVVEKSTDFFFCIASLLVELVDRKTRCFWQFLVSWLVSILQNYDMHFLLENSEVVLVVLIMHLPFMVNTI